MDIAIIFKPDGTIQCVSHAPIPLEHHAGELHKIGASKICGKANVPGPSVVMELCGAPTGRVNAFAIPRADWEIIQRGIIGTLGFRLWSGAPYPDLALDKACRIHAEGLIGGTAGSLATGPVLIRELLGRPCRCYHQGDPLSDDFNPERVNIEQDEKGRISDLWLG